MAYNKKNNNWKTTLFLAHIPVIWRGQGGCKLGSAGLSPTIIFYLGYSVTSGPLGYDLKSTRNQVQIDAHLSIPLLNHVHQNTFGQISQMAIPN